MKEVNILLITVAVLIAVIGAGVAGALQRSGSPHAKTIKASAIGFGATITIVLLLMTNAGLLGK
jgi:hypothetical protein